MLPRLEHWLSRLDDKTVLELFPVFRESIDITGQIGGLIIGNRGETIRKLSRDSRVVTRTVMRDGNPEQIFLKETIIIFFCKFNTGHKILTVSSLDEDTLLVFKSKIEEIKANAVRFQAELNLRKQHLVHVYIDMSNIMKGAQYTEDGGLDFSVRIHAKSVRELIADGRSIETGVVVGSNPPPAHSLWNFWRAEGFTVTNITPIVLPNGRFL